MTGLVPKAVDGVTIQVLVDNTIEWFYPYPPEIKTEVPYQLANGPPHDHRVTDTPYLDLENFCCGAHGLSLLITTHAEGEKHTILFDAGPESKSIARNAAALKADLAPVERIVLSHWHADHSGGILKALEIIDQQRQSQQAQDLQKVIVDLHPDRPEARGIWPPLPHLLKPIARLPEDPTLDEITSSNGQVDLHANAHTVANGFALVSGHIPRQTSFEQGLIGGCQWIDGKWDKSPENPGRLIPDERFLVIDVKDKGLVVFSSCSHAGIVNVCKAALEHFDNARPLYAVIGGYHLGGPGMEERIEPTVRYFLDELRPKATFVVPMHCSGFNAKVALRNALGGAVVPVGVGATLTFGCP